MEELKVLMISN